MGQSAIAKAGGEGRRSERVLLKIPIEVTGQTADGKTFKEKTFTLVVNRHGARITLKNVPHPKAQVTVTNLFNQMTCSFRVVGQTGRSLGEGPEWGVECLQPEADVWGIYFPPKAGGAIPEEEPIDALLECTKCAARELAPLLTSQYQALATKGSFERECAQCRASTPWRFAFVEAEPEAAVPELPPPPAPVMLAPSPVTIPEPASASAAVPGVQPPAAPAPQPPAPKIEERRKDRRVTLKLPLRIRLADGQGEVTRTENYSRNGACFASSFELKPDERVFVILNYKPGYGEIETPARIVWRRIIEGVNRSFYGVEFLGRK